MTLKKKSHAIQFSRALLFQLARERPGAKKNPQGRVTEKNIRTPQIAMRLWKTLWMYVLSLLEQAECLESKTLMVFSEYTRGTSTIFSD